MSCSWVCFHVFCNSCWKSKISSSVNCCNANHNGLWNTVDPFKIVELNKSNNMKRPPRVDPTIYFLKRRKLTDIQAAPTGGQNEWDDDSPSYETNFPNIKVRRVYGMEQIIIMKGESNWQYLGRTRKKIILIQVHGGHGKLVSIARLYSTVASKAGDNNKHVFALTLLREPTHFKI